MIILKSNIEIGYIREAGKVIRAVFEDLKRQTVPGVNLKDLEKRAIKIIRKYRAIPILKGYRKFPSALCISINEEFLHTPVKNRELKEGDIVSYDIVVAKNGYNADSAITIPVGQIPEETKRLLEVTKKSLYLAIDKAVIGNRIRDVSEAIQNYAETLNGFSVIRRFTGHGIGKEIHEEPLIPNFVIRQYKGAKITPGMVLAIETMVAMGNYEVEPLEDKMTIVTKDRSLSAHFEHTIAIIGNKTEIVT